MERKWKYTKNAGKDRCQKCGIKLLKDEIVFCEICLRVYDISSKKRWQRK